MLLTLGVWYHLGESIWKILCPPGIHVLLWLVVNNKCLTRDNLEKRRPVEDGTCLFCSEPETTRHLFFECVVARYLWQFVSDCFEMPVIMAPLVIME